MRSISTPLIFLLSIATAVISSSCATTKKEGPVQTQRPQRELYKWYDDGGPGKVTVKISLSDQIAEFKRGGRDIGWCYVATGKEGHGTSPGSYKITEKIEDKYSNRYGWIEDEMGNVTDGDAKPTDKVPAGMKYVAAPMPFWMRLTSYGIGMHGGLIPNPGEPASHGCIRIPKDFVPTLYDAVVVGTPVTISHSPSSVEKSTEGEVLSGNVLTAERPPRNRMQEDFEESPVPRFHTNRMATDEGGSDSVRYMNGRPVSR
ncbi:MAG: L,D-transpeptidase [Akkermansiaceae bacterium]|nr:L,D-transpeptidase [Akkermansiaceae bacterium]NJR41337.1 L,D-transpeptidase [Akkermansiaceae bacterium]